MKLAREELSVFPIRSSEVTEMRITEKIAAYLLISILMVSTGSASTGHKNEDYNVGTMIAWTSGNCGGMRSGNISAGNCKPGGVITYEVSGGGYNYTLMKDEEHSGIFDTRSDPLKKLMPKEQFKYRIDSKQKFIVLWEKDGKRHETRYKIGGVQAAEASTQQ